MQTMIPNLTIATMGVAALIGVAIPVVLYILLRKKGANHLPFPVQLEQVASQPIQHQAPHGERRIIVQLQQPGRVMLLPHQQAGRLLERQLIDLRRAVPGQGVVHVEADGLDVPHGQGAQGIQLVGGR